MNDDRCGNERAIRFALHDSKWNADEDALEAWEIEKQKEKENKDNE